MDEIRLGVVGMGGRGRSWVRTLQLVKGARVVALCEKIGPLLKRAVAEVGDSSVETYLDFDDMLKKGGLDAVGVVVEPHNQPDLICRALEEGKHVVSEVPLSYTIEDCWRIVLAVERTGLVYEMAEQIRYAPYVEAWKKMVDDGTLGKIVLAEGEYLHGMAEDRYWLDGQTGHPLSWEEAERNPAAIKSRFWHMPHPILYLPHDLGPVLKILEDRVTRVVCLSTRRRSYHFREFPISDVEVAVMHTAGDTVLRMTAGFNVPTPSPHHWLRLMGTRGSVETNRSSTDQMKIWLADSDQPSRQDITWQYPNPQSASPEAQASGHGGLDYYPLADFVESVRLGRAPEMDVYAAAETAAPAIMAAASVESDGMPMEVPDFRPGSQRRRGDRP